MKGNDICIMILLKRVPTTINIDDKNHEECGDNCPYYIWEGGNQSCCRYEYEDLGTDIPIRCKQCIDEFGL